MSAHMGQVEPMSEISRVQCVSRVGLPSSSSSQRLRAKAGRRVIGNDIASGRDHRNISRSIILNVEGYISQIVPGCDPGNFG